MTGVGAIVDRLERVGGEVYAGIADLRTQVVADLTTQPRRTTDLRLEGLVRDQLARPNAAVVGAGFVARPDVLSDQRYWLEWWTVRLGQSGRSAARLTVQSDPDAADFRDYTVLPWFAGPAASGSRSLVGPYVDYLCTDEYTLTFTEPVYSGDEFLGVVGADVYVDWLDRHLAADLDRLGAPVVIANAQGRVVTAYETDLLPGDLVRDTDGLWRATPCDGLPLVVLSC